MKNNLFNRLQMSERGIERLIQRAGARKGKKGKNI